MVDISEAFVAFDTSKMRNAVAIAESGRDGEVRCLGEIDNTETSTRKLVAKLKNRYQRLTFCYQAGPTGYGLYRLIKSLGHDCMTRSTWAFCQGDRGAVGRSTMRIVSSRSRKIVP